jgi:hypothetical protein
LKNLHFKRALWLVVRSQGKSGGSKVPLRVLPHMLASLLSSDVQRDESLLAAVGPRVLDLLKLSGKKATDAITGAAITTHTTHDTRHTHDT